TRRVQAAAAVVLRGARAGTDIDPVARRHADARPRRILLRTAGKTPLIARLALALVLVATLCGQVPAGHAADEAGFSQPRLELDAAGDSWMLSGDFEVPLTRSLEEAVRRGVPLYFVLEFELIRPRWWWTDETL